MSRRVGRSLGGGSILVILLAALLLLSGAGVAWAVTNAMPWASYATDDWNPSSSDPSGAAYIEGNGDYLFVVDNNRNIPASNGWMVDIQTGSATSRATDVNEPTGIDYDPDSNTLFITQDDGTLFVFEDFDTGSENTIEIDVSEVGEDIEDPAYNRDNDRLYFLVGDNNLLVELNPVDGAWGNSDDILTERSVNGLNSSSNSDWEGLAWDPRTGNLLVGYSVIGSPVIYEVTFGNPVHLENTVNMNAITGLTRINGLGVAPASFDSSKQSLWVTDRNSSQLFEVTFDGTTPPSTVPTTTTQPPSTTTTTTTSSSTTSSSTSSTSTTSSTTTSTTSSTTTSSTSTTSTSTTTTTTTMPTTTTTTPGSTTTTTQPGGGGGGGNQNPFTDDDGSVFENSIEWLAAQGITQGCNPPANTRFCPNDRVTRGQMATFLVRALDYPSTNNDWFMDDEGHIFENAINRLRQAGVTQGCNPPDNSRFCPNAYVTRGQMAAFLVRAFGYSGGASTDYFIDDNGHLFEGAINRLRTAGVTLGCNPPANNRYCPDEYVTRGQMAAFLKRALEG